MVVCTFLEHYDLRNHVIVPFITYGATTYLNETMQKIYKCTPNSVHVPATLPEDLDADDITIREGHRATDASDMVHIYNTAGELHIELDDSMHPNTIEIYRSPDVCGV